MNVKIIKSNQWLILGVSLCIMTVWGCNGNAKKNIPDVSEVNVKVEIQRFEQDLFNLDTNNLAVDIQQLNDKYGYFANLYFSEIMGFKKLNDTLSTDYINIVRSFRNYPSIQNLYDTCQTVYGDFAEIEAEFTKAFQFYKYYFPNRPTPKVTTFISEYGVAVASIGAEELIVGIDMFLGANYAPYYYQPVQLPQYITRTLNAEHVVPKTMEVLAREIVGSDNGLRLIDKMIHNGKALYLLDLFQPHVEDSIRLGITSQQTQWLKDNEGEMWRTVFVNNLYETKLKKEGLLGLIEVAPTSPGMPLESPGNAGSWVGWQIVKKYMESNPNFTIEQLLNEKEAQRILQGSRYKPK